MHLQPKSPIIAILTDIQSIIHGRKVSPEFADYCQEYSQLAAIAAELAALQEFVQALADGDLSSELSQQGVMAESLMVLQSNLQRTVRQAQQAAAGDYSQRLNFIEELSEAFRALMVCLQEAAAREEKFIAELTKNQAMLAENQRKYKLIAENSDDVIWLVNRQGITRYVSPSVERILGFKVEDFEDKELEDLPLPHTKTLFNRVAPLFLNEPSRKQPFIIETERLSKDKRLVWLETLITALRNEEGEVIGFLGVTRDISKRKKDETLLYQAYERRKTADFFNYISGKKMTDEEVHELAGQRKLLLPEQFSLFMLKLECPDEIVAAQRENPHYQQQIIDALVDYYNSQHNLTAWEGMQGIIVLADTGCCNNRQRELTLAYHLLQDANLFFPELKFFAGVANFSFGFADLTQRLRNAETALNIGGRLFGTQQVYHYEDCGIFQVLAPFAQSPEAAAYVNKLLGPLIAYDQKEHTEYLLTLEKLLAGLSFKEIGAQLFLHHKTIQLRKQKIEQILNVSLDCHETRLNMCTALRLKKILPG